jgi:hypothetical protein
MMPAELRQQDTDPTTRFTLLCLRARFDPNALTAARELAAGLDWDAWVNAARVEMLAPLLYRILRGRGMAPGAIEARLEAAYLLSARANVLRFHELDRAVHGLAAAGVQTILLKGAALAEAVYGDIGTRPMGDIDLLVRREEVQSALSVLTTLGYKTAGVETQPGTAVEFENEVVLTNPSAHNITVEVHWGLVDSPHYQQKLDMAWFWERARPAQGNASGALVLEAEAQMLHLCAHLALHHQGHGLLWLHDIAEVTHFYQDRLDWDLLLAKAAEYDLVLPLQQILLRVAEGWDVPLPAGIEERLQRMRPSAEETRVFNWLSAGRRPVAQRFWADLASMAGWDQRLRYGLGNLFPSPQYMRHRYNIQHRFLLPLYYPYRWLVGLRRS